MSPYHGPEHFLGHSVTEWHGNSRRATCLFLLCIITVFVSTKLQLGYRTSMQPNPDWLEKIHAQVRRQYEVVPFLQGSYPVDELEFKPLPGDMLDVIRSSPDFVEPAPGVPTIFMLESEEQSGGLLILKVAGFGAMLVLAPRKG